jgi:hypothetical protein
MQFVFIDLIGASLLPNFCPSMPLALFQLGHLKQYKISQMTGPVPHKNWQKTEMMQRQYF